MNVLPSLTQMGKLAAAQRSVGELLARGSRSDSAEQMSNDPDLRLCAIEHVRKSVAGFLTYAVGCSYPKNLAVSSTQSVMIHIEETTLIDAPIDRCFDLSRSVEVHLLANVHSGEQAAAVGGVTSGLVGMAAEVTWRAKHFGVWQTLTSRTTALEPPRFFQVTMVKGIFSFMQADHLFRSLNGTTEMRDVFRIAAPLPVLGPIAEVLFLRRYMLALLRERNAVIKRVAESQEWRRYLETKPSGKTDPSR